MKKSPPSAPSSHTIKKRIDYFDLLRPIAIFFVILIHCTAPYFTSLPIDSRSWLITNLFESISRWAVPIFIMISGAIHLSRKRDLKTFFKKNVLKLIIILFSWNFIYAVVDLINGSSLSTFLYSLIDGHYHLWFLYMLLGLYLLTPFFKTFLENPKYVKLFLLISFIFGIALPELSDTLALLPSHLDTIGSGLNHALGITGFGNLLGYSFYYILGYYLHHKVFNTKTKRLIYLFGFIGFFITFFVTWIFSASINSPTAIFFKDLTINDTLISIALFIYAKYHTKKTFLPNLLIRISKYSLGIYVMHLLILENVLVFLPSTIILVDIPVQAILCFIICLVLTFCLHKIPLLKKIV